MRNRSVATNSHDRPQPTCATTVGDVMHAGVLSCRPDTPVREVARIMAEQRVHAVVVDGIRRDRAGMEHPAWGVISDLDLVGLVDADEIHTATAGAMSATPAVVVAPEETLSNAARLMHDYDVHHLLVVESSTRRPVGALSTMDIAAVLAG